MYNKVNEMDIMDIDFPNLGLYLKNVPKSFSIFGFEIALYGVIIGIGVLLGILIAAQVAKKTGPGLILGFCHLCSYFFHYRGADLLCGVRVGSIQE